MYPSRLPYAAAVAGLAAAILVAVIAPETQIASATTATCGDGLLETGEDCAACAADCAAKACTPAGQRTATVELILPLGPEQAGTVVVQLAYRSDRLAIPQRGADGAVSSRFKAARPDSQLYVNDLDHAVRVAISSAGGLPPGALFDATFDTCAGAPAPIAGDLACRVDSCAGGGVPIPDCTCTVTLKTDGSVAR